MALSPYFRISDNDPATCRKYRMPIFKAVLIKLQPPDFTTIILFNIKRQKSFIAKMRIVALSV
ncbi:MAG: hypothetical protein BWK80_36610 [Desulfobacteraceae bacterium IS3]|nr:MAG: hypothetical protein BWK80_36610 [Desulfobacteraceae bacterium IS3]